MYRKHTHIHFVGIGGIGMSGIATILRHQGYRISGCDKDIHQHSITLLKELGCSLASHNNDPHICHDQSIDIVVYSSAIAATYPEIIAAQNRGIPTIPRALMLAELMRTKYSVAIAGAHGKTTTTSLISHILLEAAMDPTVIIGGHLHTISTNARRGKGDFLVAEADESDRSLLNLQATIAVVTNIDWEHVETYKDIDDIKHTFVQFLNNLPFYGKAILCVDDQHVRSLLPLPHIKTIKYGIEASDADLRACAIQLFAEYSTFDLVTDSQLFPITVSMPGKHNVLNALAAIAATRELGVPLPLISSGLASFKGVDRRFTYRGIYKTCELFDDYGHHPREIQCTLEIARKRSKNKLIVIFQPHRYKRTHALWEQFVHTFSNNPIDQLIITDIYSAGEQAIEGVTGKALVEAIERANPLQKVWYAPVDHNFSAIKQIIDVHTAIDSLILFLGAGSTITKIAPFLITQTHEPELQ